MKNSSARNAYLWPDDIAGGAAENMLAGDVLVVQVITRSP